MIQNKLKKFFQSRWSGLLLGPIYGYLIYLYLTFLFLNGPPFTSNPIRNSTMNPNLNSTFNKVGNLSDPQISDNTCMIQDIISGNGVPSAIRNNTKIKKLFAKLNNSTGSADQKMNSEMCKPLMTVETR